MSTVPAPEKPGTARRWTRRAAVFLLVLLLVCLLLGLLLLRSGIGRDLALSQLRAALPEGALDWREAQGNLSGGLTLRGVAYRTDGFDVTLDRLDVDLDGLALLAGDVRLRRVALADGRVVLPPADAPAEPWPERIELPDALPALRLPIAVHVDQLEVRNIRIEREAQPVLELQSLTARVAWVDGAFAVEALRLESDLADAELDLRIDTARRWRSQLRAAVQLALGEGARLPLDIEAQGDLRNMQINARTVSEPENSLRLQLQGGLPNPDWSLQVDAPELQPVWFGQEGEPWVVTLTGSGDLVRAQFEGTLRQGDLAIALKPSGIAYESTSLTLEPVVLGLLDGELRAEGDIDLSQPSPQLALFAVASELHLPAQEDGAAVILDATARLEGALDDYGLQLKARARRVGEAASLELEGRGSMQALAIESLDVKMPGGSLQAQGKLAWDPQVEGALEATLADFDPSWLAPGFPGAISARINMTGGLEGEAMHGQAQVSQIEGSLRGKPLQGSAHAVAEADGSGSGTLDLRIGNSRITGEGRWGAHYDVELSLAPLQMSDLLDDAGGQLRGTLGLSGPQDALMIAAQLDGHGLSLAGQSAGSLRLRADLGAKRSGVFQLEANELELGGQAFDTLSLSGEGDLARHRLDLALSGGLVDLGVRLNGGWQERQAAWQGRLESLALEPADQQAWRLREPVALELKPDDGTVALDGACLESTQGSLCATLRVVGDALEGEATLEGLELEALSPLLAGALDQPATLQGRLQGDARFSRAPSGELRAHLEATLAQLSAHLGYDADATPFELHDLRLVAELDPARATLALDARPAAQGLLELNLETATPLADDGALQGTLDLRLPDLSLLGAFSDQLVDPTGRIEGRMMLGGTRTTPQIEGAIELLDFSAELPALGITPHAGHLRLSGRDPSHADFEGSFTLGEGTVALSGNIDLGDGAQPRATATVQGENLTVMDTPEARVRASPDLTLRFDGSGLQVRGDVLVPFARIDLERMESVATPSADVVIVDEGTARSALAVDADVSVTLGDRVRMNGFGLNGTLAGQLRVRDRPGQPTTARGSLDIGGAYKAYGQDLTITRGHVAWASTPIDNPTLDVRAQRKIDAITVGVQVRGTAISPELSLWSDPSMEQAEQLSYLILGRPLRSASQADGSQLTQAAAAMGGNLLAKSLGARLGVDEIGVADNRALGGAALTVGMNLSPRLHVSYGVALFGPGQVVTFKYLLSRLWNIQIDSGSESRAALNYRLEK